MMKATVFLILFNLFTLQATVFSQSKVTMRGENVPLKSALVQIEKEAQVKFVYRDETINNFNVNFDFQNSTIEETLNVLLKGTGNTYRPLENNLIVITTVDMAVQGIQITGTVTGDSGESLPGVNVVVKGTLTGTVTDVNGKYSINVPNESAILQFSFVGYSSQEFEVGTRRIVDVTLNEDASQIEEVVVVGYGVQRKVNLTGSVSTIASNKLENRSAPNLSTSLTGLAAGVSVRQGSGNPGSDGANIRIRGIGTFSNDYRSPLVIVDGVQATMDAVNPNDVESISY